MTISHGEAAGITETAADNLIPPGAEEAAKAEPWAEGEVDRLGDFLTERFPDEVGLSNRQTPETPVDVAIRLLTGLTAVGDTPRCTEEYCNKTQGHRDGHGWVHFH